MTNNLSLLHTVVRKLQIPTLKTCQNTVSDGNFLKRSRVCYKAVAAHTMGKSWTHLTVSNAIRCSARKWEVQQLNSCMNLQNRCYASKCKADSDSAKSGQGDDVKCVSEPGQWPTGKRENFQFHPETEAIMNEQLAAELKASYYYLSMAVYFGRVDVALPGCESFFMQMHKEEHDHALQFINYIKMRGGVVKLCPVCAPQDQDWRCPVKALQAALQLEMEITEKLVAVNSVAEKHKDLNASDFIVTEFMEDQMKSINEIAKLITVLSGIGDQGLARFIFDKHLLKHYVTPEFSDPKNH